MNEQLPTVGRVNQPYHFQIANTTYKSTNYVSVDYSASNLPSWLQFDGASRSFSGTPLADDEGQFLITLTGYDSSDNTSMSNQYDMIVSDDSGLQLSSNSIMIYEIAKFGKTNGDAGLVVKQGQKFNIQFTKDVFELKHGATRPIIAYYGRSADRSSLPNWITFNPDDLTFSGTVPFVTSDIAPSFDYGFSFLASDYYGYSGAEGNFKLVVGAHELSTSINDTIKLNGTYGEEVEIDIPVLSTIYFDDNLISKSNISTIYSENLPSYLKLDVENFQLSGKYPLSYTFDNFTIVVEDVYQNTVQLPYSVKSLGTLFTTRFPNVNATKDKWFQYHLMDLYFTDLNHTTIDVDYSALWLSYNKDNRTLSGQAPENLNSVTVTVNAESSFGSGSESFMIKGINPNASSSSTPSATASSSSSSESSSESSASATESAVAKSSEKSGINKKGLIIGLSVGIPCFVILLALMIFFLCCVKKRNNKDESDVTAHSETDMEKGSFEPNPFGMTVDKSNTNSPKRLQSLNALKLTDEKLDGYDDVHSTSSTLTHVDSDESRYYDAVEKTVKSWRYEDKSDMAVPALGTNRVSEGSLSTVNTDQLFSVRLVDESNRGSLGSLNSMLRSDSSGNFQRLDSNGDLVDTATFAGEEPAPKFRRSHSQNLDVLLEETASNTHNRSDASVKTLDDDNEKIVHDTSSMSMNLLSKVDASQIITKSNSDELIDQNSLGNDFTATKTDKGEFKWLAQNPSPIPSPDEDSFVFNSDNTMRMTPMKNSNLSALSVNSSDFLLSDNTTNSGTKYNTNGSKSKAKLVEFTRKGSLRESAYEPDYEHHEESAKIEEEEDSD
jgi:axial budding pattern protein 2